MSTATKIATVKGSSLADDREIVEAINRSQAVIQFDLDGIIQDANDNFLTVLGYSIEEIKGKHHEMFCEPAYTKTKDYTAFWDKLRSGNFHSGEYKRIAKDGSEVWIQATYNPILDDSGKPTGVIKFATDITEQVVKFSDLEGKMQAISKAQAIIEFNLDGTIITANDNFLHTLGYTLDEIEGRHHRMFCEPAFVNSPRYAELWDNLRKGRFDSGEYKRLGKGGKEIWINASYNPIFDPEGRVFKVVKFATDITETKMLAADSASKLDAIDKSQAVIEFEMDGTIIKANSNFLAATGYSLDQIVGKHHRMFCENEYVNSSAYRELWAKLGRGEFDQGEYKRIGAGGKEIYIQASYNPILDLEGKPYKVVKFATDLTKEKELYNSLVDSFDQACQQLSAASEELSATASQLSGNSNKTKDVSRSAAASAEQVSGGVLNVVTSTEELAASVKEISIQATEASRISQSASNESQESAANIEELGRASQEIGNVIKVISSIAQQTNLLALNATIEAARAGDAGRGFAVVANEVKELAKQTASATEDITERITGIQDSTSKAIAGNEKISTVIEKLNAIAGNTAAAVEEQNQTTNEVARTLAESKQGVEEITRAISEVALAAEENSTGARETLNAAQQLSQLAIELRDLVNAARKN